MDNKLIIEVIEKKDIVSFLLEWKTAVAHSEEDTRAFLCTIVDYHYKDDDSEFFFKVFNTILEKKISLDFSIDHYAPTFISLVAYNGSTVLLDYFIEKGADINFVGDRAFFDPDEYSDDESGRFWTCLDFMQLVLDDTTLLDYDKIPFKIEIPDNWWHIGPDEKITINKRDLYELADKANLLDYIISVIEMTDNIKSIGGKTYEELNKTSE